MMIPMIPYLNECIQVFKNGTSGQNQFFRGCILFVGELGLKMFHGFYAVPRK